MMWRKILAVVVLTLTLATLGGSVVSANAASPVNTPASLLMQGQASVVYDQSGAPQLRIRTQSTTGDPWLLEVTLKPTGNGQNAGVQVVNLSGVFTLGLPQQPIATGTVTGWINANANGNVKFSDGKSATSLNMTFSIANDGSTTAITNGVWPAIPVPQSTPASDTPTPPAQPTNHFFWYLSRTAAMIAYILLFINICLGLVTRSKSIEKVIGRWQMLDLHQFTALLAMGFIGLHIFSLMGDHYLKFGLKEVLVPGASPYRQVWTTIGVIGFYMAIVVVFSFYIRKFIGYKAWRFIHYFSFIVFVVILIHSIMAGTDSTALWAKWLYIFTGTTTVFLFLWRFLSANASVSQPTLPNRINLSRQAFSPGKKLVDRG